jgi:hypothetical protein
MIDLEPRFKSDFENLIRGEGLDNIEAFMEPVDLFEEVPLYSRFAQLSFLSEVPPIEKNKLLIRAATWQLSNIVTYCMKRDDARASDFYCMLSILDWEDFDAGGLVTPTFWYTNPSRGVLAQLQFTSSLGTHGVFVLDSLDRDADIEVQEEIHLFSENSYMERVYVRLK